MDTQQYRQSSESIEEFLFRLNEETSLGAVPMLKTTSSPPVGWMRLIFSPLLRCASSLSRHGEFRGGITSLINAVLAGIYTLASMAKIWEYQFRNREGKGLLPPVTKEELQRFTQV